MAPPEDFESTDIDIDADDEGDENSFLPILVKLSRCWTHSNGAGRKQQQQECKTHYNNRKCNNNNNNNKTQCSMVLILWMQVWYRIMMYLIQSNTLFMSFHTPIVRSLFGPAHHSKVCPWPTAMPPPPLLACLRLWPGQGVYHWTFADGDTDRSKNEWYWYCYHLLLLLLHIILNFRSEFWWILGWL